MPGDFCHLHVHSQYSLLDGMSRIPELVARAMQMGQPALALTDHENMFGAIEFYKACQEATKAAKKEGRPGLKPILGMEAYIVPEGKPRGLREKVDGEFYYHCLLWAENEEGFRNLMKLSTLAFAEGFYQKARIDRESLARHAQGLLGSTGCLSAEIPSAILHKDYAAARRIAGEYSEIFGRGNFYFELQNQAGLIDPAQAAAEGPGGHDLLGQRKKVVELIEQERKVNEAILRLAAELGGKVIATNDSHYTLREDAAAHDALLCIGTASQLSDEKRYRFACEEFYLKSTDEMRALFPDGPQALANTLEVAERCRVELKFGTYHYPAFPIPGGESPEAYFRRLVEEGLVRRYGTPLSPEVRARADEELRVLIKMGFVGYLLIVWDITHTARQKGIPVGPGRGSAVGSIVCYALGITDLDPLRYNLLFERFVNEGRNEMPDIDLDFCQARREEIIQYVQGKYGRENTAGIITFNSMAAKGALRDVGRVLGWEPKEIDPLSKLVPQAPGKKVTLHPRQSDDDGIYAVDDVPELKALYTRDPRVRSLVDMARKIEGLVRNAGRHAAGLVIADRPITEYCPLYRDKDGALLTQFEMGHLDSVGLLKVDFLGLETLTIIHTALRFIQEKHGVDLDLARIPLNDAATFRVFQRGETKAVFQFESDGMVRMLLEAQPDCLEDLTALNAMFRPGPLQNIPAFIRRKHGKEPIEYLIPQLEPILRETYGIIVYQEQVMQIANQLAGFTLSEADKLRKAMGKKIKKVMDQYGEKFEAGSTERKVELERAKQLYETIKKFAEYGFNKSHAAAYALVAYQTAYLKAHYPAEYMAACISLKQGDKEKMALYLEEARRMGLEIAGPDVNASGATFSIEGAHRLRFSLGAVKGVGEKAVESIIATRREGGPFKGLYDFCERAGALAVNKGALECLIKAGALDSLADEGGRGRLAAALEEALARGASVRRDRALGQGSLFGESDGSSRPPPLPPVPDWPLGQRLKEERKVLGFYLSGHPLQDVRELVTGLSSASCRGMAQYGDGMQVVLGAYVTAITPKATRKDNRAMAVLTLEDFSGSLQAVVFPDPYDKYKSLLAVDQVRFFRGRIKHDEMVRPEPAEGGEARAPAVSILVDEVLDLDTAVRRYLRGVQLTLGQEALIPAPEQTPAPESPSAARKTPAREAAPSEGAAFDLRSVQARLDSLTRLLRLYPGPAEVWMSLDLEDGPGAPATVHFRAGQGLRVQPSLELLKGLRELLPWGAVQFLAEGTQAKWPERRGWQARNGARAAT